MTTAAILHLIWPGNGFTVSKKGFFSRFLNIGMRKEIMECRGVFKYK